MYELHHGDCLDILPTLAPQSVDAVICDLPYGVTSCKWDSVIPFEPMWRELKRVIKPRGAIVLFGSQPFTSALVMSNPKWFRYGWVWEKSKATGFLDAQRKPLLAHEDMLIFSAGSTIYNPQKTKGSPYSGAKRAGQKGSATDVYSPCADPFFRHGSADGSRFPRTVLYFPTAESEGRTSHPTQKPVALLEYLVKTYTNEGDTVLDFTFGSGTTGVACANTGRRFVGIERDEHYFNVAQERIASAYAPLAHMEQVA